MQAKYAVDESDQMQKLRTGGGIQHSSKSNKGPAGSPTDGKGGGCLIAATKKKTPTAAEKKLAEAAKRKGQKSILGMFARAPPKKKSKTTVK